MQAGQQRVQDQGLGGWLWLRGVGSSFSCGGWEVLAEAELMSASRLSSQKPGIRISSSWAASSVGNSGARGWGVALLDEGLLGLVIELREPAFL